MKIYFGSPSMKPKKSATFLFFFQEITLISDTILEELLAEVREYIWFLYQLSETVSLIDLLLSLAAVSMNQDFTKVNIYYFDILTYFLEKCSHSKLLKIDHTLHFLPTHKEKYSLIFYYINIILGTQRCPGYSLLLPPFTCAWLLITILAIFFQ